MSAHLSYGASRRGYPDTRGYAATSAPRKSQNRPQSSFPRENPTYVTLALPQSRPAPAANRASQPFRPGIELILASRPEKMISAVVNMSVSA
jgi:hypothetical protein